MVLFNLLCLTWSINAPPCDNIRKMVSKYGEVSGASIVSADEDLQRYKHSVIGGRSLCQ